MTKQRKVMVAKFNPADNQFEMFLAQGSDRTDMLYDLYWKGRPCKSACSICDSGHACYYYDGNGKFNPQAAADPGDNCDACIPSGATPFSLDPATVGASNDQKLFVMDNVSNVLTKRNPQPLEMGPKDQAYREKFAGATIK